MISRLLFVSVALASTPSVSSAQTVGGAPAATPAPVAQPLGGPVVAGVCLLSREAIFANAAVGKAASARLEDITRTAQGEIDAQRATLEAEAKALRGQPDNTDNRQRRETVASRWQALQHQADHVSREIDATRAKALQRIADEAQPVIAQVYSQKECGLLLDRGTALGGNFANDLTADVVRGLDTKIQTISFEQERLPQTQIGAPAAR